MTMLCTDKEEGYDLVGSKSIRPKANVLWSVTLKPGVQLYTGNWLNGFEGAPSTSLQEVESALKHNVSLILPTDLIFLQQPYYRVKSIIK